MNPCVFQFSEINWVENSSNLVVIEKVGEIVRMALNMLDEICPGYRGMNRAVQKLIRDTRRQIAPNLRAFAPDIDEIFRIRESLNYCVWKWETMSLSLDSLFLKEIRRWHEIRTYTALIWMPCKSKRETQTKMIKRYFNAIDAGDLEKVYSMYDKDIQYSRTTFHRKWSKIVSVSYPPFGDVVFWPIPIPGKASFMRYYDTMRDMSGKHAISYITNWANWSVISEWSYTWTTRSWDKQINIPRWRDIVYFNVSWKIVRRYSLIEKDE